MQMFKLYFQDASSEAAYQASVTTRDRALEAQKQSIDIMKRLLSQMEDDPLLALARESLEKILKNPEVITDEVFSNIMSKTQEVLDANYDSQIEQFLDTARSRGVSGDTLAIQLQKAKSARAQGMAAAYRDTLIARAKEGLATSIEAVNATFSSLSQHNAQKLQATEDLVNLYQSVVPEPFRNYGAPSEAMPTGAGGGGGAGGARTPINIDYSTLTPTMLAGELPLGTSEWQGEGAWWEPSKGPKEAGGTLTDAERAGTAGTLTTEQLVAMSEATAAKNAAMTPEQRAAQAEAERQAYVQNGISQEQAAALQTEMQKQFAPQAPVKLDTGALQSSLQTNAQNLVNQQLASTSPVNLSAPTQPTSQYTVPGNVRTGVAPTTYSITPQGTLSNMEQGMTTLQGPGLGTAGVTMGGGTAEAQRVASMIGEKTPTGQIITPQQIIGTTAGGGVRKDAVAATPTVASVAAKAGLDPNVVAKYWSNENFNVDTSKGRVTYLPGSFKSEALAAMKRESEKKKTTSQQLADKLIVTSSGTGYRK